MVSLKGLKTYEEKRRKLMENGFTDISPVGLKDESKLRRVSPKGKVSYQISYTIRGYPTDPKTGDKIHRVEILGSGSETFKNEREAVLRLRKLRDFDSDSFEVTVNLRQRMVSDVVEDYLEWFKQKELDNGADLQLMNTQKKLSAERSYLVYFLDFCNQRFIVNLPEVKSEIGQYRLFLASAKKRAYDRLKEKVVETDKGLSLVMADKCIRGLIRFASYCTDRDPNLNLGSLLNMKSIKSSKEIAALFKGRTKEGAKRVISDEEFLKIIEASSQPMTARLITGALTGIRPTKVGTLTWEEVDFENQQLVLIGYEKMHFKGKPILNSMKTLGDKTLVLPMSNELMEVLKIQQMVVRKVFEYYKLETPFVFPVITRKESLGKPYVNDSNLNKSLKSYCLKSGVPFEGVTSYSLRTTFNNRCQFLSEEQYRRSTNKNVEDYRFSEKELQYLLGHSLGSSIKAQHYDRATPEFIDSMRDKLNRIPYGFDMEMLKEKYQEINIPHKLRDGIARRLKGEF